MASGSQRDYCSRYVYVSGARCPADRPTATDSTPALTVPSLASHGPAARSHQLCARSSQDTHSILLEFSPSSESQKLCSRAIVSLPACSQVPGAAGKGCLQTGVRPCRFSLFTPFCLPHLPSSARPWCERCSFFTPAHSQTCRAMDQGQLGSQWGQRGLHHTLGHSVPHSTIRSKQ